LSGNSVSEPGSDLGRALRAAGRLLPAGRREEQVIALWTDGEDLEAGARSAADELAETGVRVFTVGVGTPAGDIVPVLDDQGRAVDVKRDEDGTAVRSRLDQEVLRYVARRTRGGYFAASRPGGELPRLMAALGSVSQSARGERLIERPVARFAWCAVAAALLLAFERMHLRRRRAGARVGEVGAPTRRRRLTPDAVAAAALLAWIVTVCAAPSANGQSAWARGDRAFRGGRFHEADSLYSRRLDQKDHPSVRLNRATARALTGAEGRKAALTELEGLAGRDDVAGRESSYNLGTLLGEDQELDRALTTLRRALERHPEDEDARWNYEVLKQRKQQQDERREPPQQPPPPDPKPEGSPPPSPPPPSPGAPQQQPAPHSSAPRPSTGMTRAQAEQILDALHEMQRMEQQRQRRVRVLQERRGRDW
jgi:Ca-activated chloride channel family protein